MSGYIDFAHRLKVGMCVPVCMHVCVCGWMWVGVGVCVSVGVYVCDSSLHPSRWRTLIPTLAVVVSCSPDTLTSASTTGILDSQHQIPHPIIRYMVMESKTYCMFVS